MIDHRSNAECLRTWAVCFLSLERLHRERSHPSTEDKALQQDGRHDLPHSSASSFFLVFSSRFSTSCVEFVCCLRRTARCLQHSSSRSTSSEPGNLLWKSQPVQFESTCIHPGNLSCFHQLAGVLLSFLVASRAVYIRDLTNASHRPLRVSRLSWETSQQLIDRFPYQIQLLQIMLFIYIASASCTAMLSPRTWSR